MGFSIILIIIFWGAWGFLERFALFFGTPYQTLFVFFVLTTVLLLPYTILMLKKKQGRNGFKISPWVWLWTLAAVLSDLIAIIALRFAFLHAPTGIVMATTSVYPVITVIFSLIFLREKISKLQFMGIVLACAGIFILSV